jgi:DNA repair protein RadC
MWRAERAGSLQVAEVGGVPLQKARRLLAGLVLGRHSALSSWSERRPVRKAEDIAAAYGPWLASLDHERFYVLSLDAKNRLVGEALVARGTVGECPVFVREAFVQALREGAAGVIFLHNHPSGDPAPSKEDFALTERLVAAGEILGIPVLDHLVIGREGFVSFSDQSML